MFLQNCEFSMQFLAHIRLLRWHYDIVAYKCLTFRNINAPE